MYIAIFKEILFISLNYKLIYTCYLTKFNKRKMFIVYKDMTLISYTEHAFYNSYAYKFI